MKGEAMKKARPDPLLGCVPRAAREWLRSLLGADGRVLQVDQEASQGTDVTRVHAVVLCPLGRADIYMNLEEHGR